MDSHQSGPEAIDRISSKRLKIDTMQVLILVLVVTVSTGTAVYAASFTWTTANRIRVIAPNLGVYADAALTQSAPSSVDWGTFHPGDHTALNYWIRNEASNTLSLSWTSDLSANSVTGYVSDSWSWSDGQTWRNLNGHSIAPGGVLATQYIVTISTITPASTYTWSLTLSGA